VLSPHASQHSSLKTWDRLSKSQGSPAIDPSVLLPDARYVLHRAPYRNSHSTGWVTRRPDGAVALEVLSLPSCSTQQALFELCPRTSCFRLCRSSLTSGSHAFEAHGFQGVIDGVSAEKLHLIVRRTVGFRHHDAWASLTVTKDRTTIFTGYLMRSDLLPE